MRARLWPQALIFDLDGTLVDSFPGIMLGLNRALEELELPPRDLAWVRCHVGHGAQRLVADAASDDVAPQRLLEGFRHHYGEVLCEHTHAYPGVSATLQALVTDHQLAVASNKPRQWVRRLVDHLGWSNLLQAVVGPEDANAHKPDPAMIRIVLEQLGCRREDALLVGDMPVDVATGRAAGIPTVGVTTGSTPAHTLAELGCIAVIAGVHELESWLASL